MIGDRVINSPALAIIPMPAVLSFRISLHSALAGIETRIGLAAGWGPDLGGALDLKTDQATAKPLFGSHQTDVPMTEQPSGRQFANRGPRWLRPPSFALGFGVLVYRLKAKEVLWRD
jgi:hypothetical protein